MHVYQIKCIQFKVIDVLTGEGHKFIFSEYRPSMTSSSDSTVCIASSPESRPGLTSTPVDRTSSSSIPEARPSSSSIPEGRPSSSSIPEGRPSSSSIPEARPSSSSIPEARPSSSSIPEARPSSSSIPEGRPSSSSIPEARPSSSSIPEVRPSCSSIPEARPSSFSIPEGRPSSSSIPEARPSSTSIPEARPSSSSATPGSSPSSESLCCMSSGHNQEINVQCPSDPPGKLLGGQASTPRPQNPLLLSEEDLSDRELMPYANSIINIIMQKMHHDDDLYESVGGQKPLSPRRRSRSALLSQYSHQDNSEISVLYIPKRADRKSLKSVDPKALRVVRWVLQTIHRRHGWLGQANDHSRQAKESLLLCDVIQVLLEKLDHKMATTGDLQVAPTQTYALHTDDRFKTKLQEATVEPISDIIGHLSINLLRSESCFVPKKRWSSSSTRAKSVSMTNLGSRAAASAVAMDISSKVVEKLKEASGSSKTTCSMTSLRDFVRAMTVSQPELSQQATSCGSKIHNVYREVLEIVVTKLRSFVTKGGSFHKPTEHLAQKMAESCLEVECAFMEILQTLKSHGTGDEACSAWAVDCMSTTISDTMFKRVTEGGHPPHLTHVSGATVTNCGPIRVSDVNQKRPIKIKARMSRSSVNLLQTTVEKFVHKLTGERVSIPELGEGMSTSTSPQQGKDPENLQRFTTEPPSELSPRSQLKREELISMLCALMSKSIISSLSLDRAFLVPVDAVSDTKESRASAVKLGRNTSTLVPTPPPRPTHTNSQTDNKPVQEDSRRRFRPLRTLQAAKRVVSSMDLGISRTTSRSSGVVGQLACPAKSNNNLFSEPPSTSAASSNTSLVASEITENVVCQLLQGDSPDFMSSSNHTSPRGTTFN
uniref:Uncharacterized protein n=1 Tax=Oncorhynchus kisutch TaxID=8019 RepID=A0A8C7FCM2_ONCKI